MLKEAFGGGPDGSAVGKRSSVLVFLASWERLWTGYGAGIKDMLGFVAAGMAKLETRRRVAGAVCALPDRVSACLMR